MVFSRMSKDMDISAQTLNASNTAVAVGDLPPRFVTDDECAICCLTLKESGEVSTVPGPC